jgi:rhodanese-related sulfurtransferase
MEGFEPLKRRYAMERRTELLFLRVVFLILLIFTLLLVGSKVFGETGDQYKLGKYKVIKADDLKSMMSDKDFVLINVSFRCNGYIPGTDREIPFNLIDRYCDTIPPPEDAKVILYCNRGYMSRVAARKLLTMGYREVYVLEGGLEHWELEGNPVVGRSSR